MTQQPRETPAGEPLLEFADLMRHLRRACVWKAGQTHTSLARYLLEETYETLEAIEVGEETQDWAPLRDELGDLLLQVYFHAVVAEERGEFTLDDVAAGISAKMVRRNPHVFGPDARSDLTPEEVNELWQQAKAAEKGAEGVAQDPAGPEEVDPSAGLPPGLPALLWADKVADRAARAGRPLQLGEPDAGADEGADAEPDVEAVLGERLLSLVLEARAAGVDPERALRRAVRSRL